MWRLAGENIQCGGGRPCSSAATVPLLPCLSLQTLPDSQLSLKRHYSREAFHCPLC